MHSVKTRTHTDQYFSINIQQYKDHLSGLGETPTSTEVQNEENKSSS